jgi:septal ring factor EnvC (AmiA/AmiB activator)
MTDNQFNQLFGLVTKCVNGIQKLETDVADLKQGQAELREGQARLETDVAELKTDVAELKGDVAELKSGQARLEKEIQINNKALAILTDESLRTRARVEILEQQKELTN